MFLTPYAERTCAKICIFLWFLKVNFIRLHDNVNLELPTNISLIVSKKKKKINGCSFNYIRIFWHPPRTYWLCIQKYWLRRCSLHLLSTTRGSTLLTLQSTVKIPSGKNWSSKNALQPYPWWLLVASVHSLVYSSFPNLVLRLILQLILLSDFSLRQKYNPTSSPDLSIWRWQSASEKAKDGLQKEVPGFPNVMVMKSAISHCTFVSSSVWSTLPITSLLDIL